MPILWEKQAKRVITTKDELMEKCKKDYTETAEKMVKQLVLYSERKE
ncbi:hypothetical protein ABID22_003748 [Pontibacter aydingkolensis]